MRPADERYFEAIEADLDEAMAVASEARERGGDPTDDVEIPMAQDMADRVENILGIDGVAERVRDLEDDYSREEAALALVEDFVEGTVGDFETRAATVEGAVRTAVALLTEGVVAAPIEGIDRVELEENDDGTEYVAVYYAGPIRSAGGTAQALSVLVADYARTLLDIEAFQPRDDEVERYAEEVALYDDEAGLQYSPKAAETTFITEHCPIMLDGEATGDEEVSGFRDLDRIDTNASRGGMCLVLAEGIALKAPKIQRYTRSLDEVAWPWLQDLIDDTIGDGEGDGDDDADEIAPAEADGEDAAEAAAGPPRVDPSGKYLRDLIAGRPVFAHPSTPGGFRLRYGRARNHGFATAGVHPATMHLVEDFLATGTQIKTERPGKAAGVVPVDSIEGPTVRLANGDVRRIDDPAEALEVRNGVEAILDLGEYLVNYGEFVENNHPLAPASYVVEWWSQDLDAAGADVQALRDRADIDLADPTAAQALSWATETDAPLHPQYTYCWHDVSVDAVLALSAALDGSRVEDEALLLPPDVAVRETLEALLVEHHQGADATRVPDWRPLVRTLGFDDDLDRDWTEGDLSTAALSYAGGDNAIELVNELAPFAVRERAPTRVGNRMGRPEKSEERELSPAVHTLFPIGEAGGAQRDVAAAAGHADGMADTPGEVDLQVGRRRCEDCGTVGFQAACPDCGGATESVYRCPDCEAEVEPDESGRAECTRCETLASPTQTRPVDVGRAFRDALETVGERETAFDVLKGVKGLSSEAKVPEPMAKGVLRAKHDVSAFKDGTVRYDMTDLPVTAVRPRELDVDADRLRELGYETDLQGEPLTHDDQLVQLKVQDVVLSNGAAEHMLQTAAFVDDLLEGYYGLERYYEFDDRDDMVGELVFGMAPHTSAAVVGRVVGFTSAAVGYAHPYFHASKRRNCFHPETELLVRDGEARSLHEKANEGIPPEEEPRRVPIREFVETRLESPAQDAAGALVQELDDEPRTLSYQKGLNAPGTVSTVSKHPAPDHLIEVQIASGQTLRVTHEHEMLRLDEANEDDIDNYRVERVPAQDLQPGDEVPTPAEPPSPLADGSIEEYLFHGGKDLHDFHSRVIDWETIERVEIVASDVEYVYCLEEKHQHTVCANGMYTGQCDGDEDCVMLLLDGLLNFSKSFLPDQRGGRMDAPLVMTSRLDPTEIDDEAHNMDIVERYPRSFYEATREMADPETVDVTIAEETLGTERQYTDFGFTHDTTDIALGPDLSAYKTLNSMMDKMEAQLELARRLRAVDETDVAERVIEYHFLPDIIGNLRAFSRQEVRCTDCGEKFRRMPLSGDCRECGGNVTLTVHEGSVTKYIDTATQVAEEYGTREYTKQRLQILEQSIDSIFVDDTNKQSGIADFM